MIRYNRDKVLLAKELEKNPTDPRTLFYMGQTCDCLHLYNEAIHYYERRAAILDRSVPEEVYHAKYRMGNNCIRLGKSHEEIVKHYTDAYEFWNRVEPILRLCEYFLFVRKQPRIAYGYASMALVTPYPDEALLFVSNTDYNYLRYNRFMCAAFEVGDYARACAVAACDALGRLASAALAHAMALTLAAPNVRFGAGDHELEEGMRFAGDYAQLKAVCLALMDVFATAVTTTSTFDTTTSTSADTSTSTDASTSTSTSTSADAAPSTSTSTTSAVRVRARHWLRQFLHDDMFVAVAVPHPGLAVMLDCLSSVDAIYMASNAPRHPSVTPVAAAFLPSRHHTF